MQILFVAAWNVASWRSGSTRPLGRDRDGWDTVEAAARGYNHLGERGRTCLLDTAKPQASYARFGA
jgi:hypothetical protein